MGIIRATRLNTNAQAVNSAGYSDNHGSEQSYGDQFRRERSRAQDASYYQRQLEAVQNNLSALHAIPSDDVYSISEQDTDYVYDGAHLAPPNEALDAALHLASHAHRLNRLEQNLDDLRSKLRQVGGAVKREKHQRAKSLLMLGGACAAGLLLVGLLPREISDQVIAAKAKQAVQALANDYQNMQGARTPPAPLVENAQPPSRPTALGAMATSTSNIMAPQDVPEETYAPLNPAQNTQASLARRAAAIASIDADELTPSIIQSAPAPTAAPALAPQRAAPPPMPPIRVAEVFTPLQNQVRDYLAKRGEMIPADWQSMFDRDAKGDLKGKLQIAAKFLKGEGVTRDQNFAIALIKEAAKAGEKEAVLWLAYAYQAGNLGRVDLAQAASWFERAARAGITKAYVELGHIYETGVDGAPDIDTALAWYQRAALAGDHNGAAAVARLNAASLNMSAAQNGFQGQNEFQDNAQNIPEAGTPIQPSPASSPTAAVTRTLSRAVANQGGSPTIQPAYNQPESGFPIDNYKTESVQSNIAANIPVTPPAEGSTRNLAMRDTQDVRALQRMLKALGHGIDKIDGVMGPSTTGAVRAYQRQKMMYPDGQPSGELMESLINDIRWGG